MASKGFEGPICVLGGPASVTLGSHPEWGQSGGILRGWGLQETSEGVGGKGWSLGFGP